MDQSNQEATNHQHSLLKKMSAEGKKRVVIVGAGVGTRCLLAAMPAKSKKRDRLHITVIQPNKFSEMPWYCTQEITKKETFESISTRQPIPNADVTLYGVAVGCGDGTLAIRPLEEGKDIQLIAFDIIVCATGVSFPSVLATPGQSSADRKAEVEKMAEALTSPNTNVVIAGGGHVGVELAGDALEERSPDGTGSVTLVCSSERLIPDRPEKYGAKALQKLQEFGCNVILDDRVTNQHNQMIGNVTVLELQSGKTLECDAYIPAYNRGPNTQWLTEVRLPDRALPLPRVLNDKKQVIVDDYLVSKAYPKLFAIGATNDRGEAVVGMNVKNQTQTIATNILSPRSKKHKPGPLQFPLYQTIGHKTYAFITPEAIGGTTGTIVFKWCGFPCNLLCPCFLCGIICGPMTPMCCGYCCGEPEGVGFIDVLRKSKEMNLVRKMMNYPGLGDQALVEVTMDRF